MNQRKYPEEDPPIPLEGLERPENFEGLLRLLSDSAALRNRLHGYAHSGPGLALETIARCRDRMDRQVDQSALDDEAPLEWPALQRLAHTVSPPARTLSDLLFRLQYLVCGETVPGWDAVVVLDRALDTATIDEEVIRLLDALNERNLKVLRQRFCAKHNTLREIGEGFGLSRERVRQLESEVVNGLQRAYVELPLPRMRTAMARVREISPASPEDIVRTLLDNCLLADDSSVEDFMIVWRAIQPKAQPFPEEGLDFSTSGLNPRQRRISAEVKSIARRHLRSTGAVAVEDIVADVGPTICSKEDVTAILARANIRKLVEDYWGYPNKDCAVHKVAQKMVKACGPLDAEHIHIGLLRHQQRHGFARVAPPSVLRTVLDAHDAFYLDDRGAVHLHDLTQGALPNPAEYAWLEAAFSHGPVVHVSTMYRALDKNGVNNGLMTYLPSTQSAGAATR